MPRAPRRQSEADIYHVFARGVGRQIIFEDDADRTFFLKTLGKLLSEYDGDLLAWVLMGNHFHLLFRMPLDRLSGCMRELQAVYAQRFNARYEHAGHLFQGRFGSQPIESDEQLMACVRYIHRNPIEAGLCQTCDYKWSSFRSYVRQEAAVTNVGFVAELLGGINRFIEFHEKEDDGRFSFLDVEECDSDERARKIANSVLGEDWREKLAALDKSERDEWLRWLKGAGLSVRQIERLTGFGRGVISRA